MAETADSSGPQRIPMADPVSAAWEVPISGADYGRLLGGFSPQDMDDRWCLRADGPDAQGRSVLRMYRSWTGHEQIALTVQETGISQIRWNRQEGVEEKDAKDLAKALCQGLLGCDLEALS